MTTDGLDWLALQGIELPVSAAAKEKAQIDSGLDVHDWPYVTPWLAQVAQPAEAPTGDPEGHATPSLAGTLDQLDQAAADLDATVLAMVEADAEILTAKPAKVFADLGIVSARSSAADVGLIVLIGPGGKIAADLTIDQASALPDSRAEVLTALIAHQLRRVMA